MKNNQLKNTLRSLHRTRGRFISILAIIAIGCAFFSGIKSSSGYMMDSAYKFVSGHNTADFRLRSTLGFSEDDVTALSESPDISDIYAGYSADLFITRNTENLIVSAYSYSADSDINIPEVMEGRLPESPDECVADYSPSGCEPFKIGEKITLSADSDSDIEDILSQTEYTIVGLVHSPLYISHSRDTSTIGNGSVNGYILIPEESFSYESYTDIYLCGESLSGLNCFHDEYSDRADITKESLEALADERVEIRREEVRKTAEEDISDARKELEDAEKEYKSGKDAYDSAVKQLETGRKELDEKKKELENAQKQYEDGAKQLEKAQEDFLTLQQTCLDIDDILEEYLESYVQTLPDELVNNLKDIQSAYDAFEINVNMRDMLAIYIITDPAADAAGKKEMRRQISSANELVRSQTSHIALQIQEQSELLNDTQLQISDGKKQLKEGETQLTDSEKQLEDSKTELEDARAELDDGYAELEKSENELNDAIENGKWYVLTRGEAFSAYAEYANDCERVDNVALIFPLFFILIGALVCVCTMTRMVEEQRTEIGTFKALGFEKGSIAMQYVIYAAAASILGSVIGVCISLPILPRIIFNAYVSLYDFPDIETPFKWTYLIGCLAVSVICTSVSAYAACKRELSAEPAQLMRPRPPKSGRRVFLERLPFIWKKLSFTFKVTFRNLLRYKSRFLMSVLGIAGCTSLLVAGFSLQHAISSIVDLQFGGILTYDAAIAFDTDADIETLDELTALIDGNDTVNSYMGAYQAIKEVSSDSKTVSDCYIVAPEDINELGNYIKLRERKSGLKLYIPEDGAIINEKLANVLGVKVGGTINVEDGSRGLTVLGITENYANNYVYITQKTCDELLGESASNSYLIDLADGFDNNAFSEQMLKNDAVLSVTFSADGGDRFRDLIESLTLVVILIIVFSGALAFVILFNLVTINVNERIHELATLKVLGFYDGEVSSYIFRENIFSTLIGMLLGLAGGVGLLKIVIIFAEADSVMFNPTIPGYCFAVAAAITILFSTLVNITMHFRMKSIDMATSLKAVE